eukprot:6475041-Amphidinium_carterae.1
MPSASGGYPTSALLGCVDVEAPHTIQLQGKQTLEAESPRISRAQKAREHKLFDKPLQKAKIVET